MVPRMRTRNGLERPSSGSLKTPESAEKDQQAHECLRQIEEQCELTQESFDYLLKLLSDRSSLQISILPSCDIDEKLFDLSSNFVAPLFRPITQNWSVIYIQTIVDSGRYTINVKHYCPDPSQQRRSKVVDERRKERSEHNEVVEKKKKELETCQDKRASLVRIHKECEKACTELDARINDGERRVSKWLAEFPQNLHFTIDREQYKTPGEARWKPEKDNLMEAQNRKRKSNESLDSANQDFSYLERVVENVLEEGRVIEEGVKSAYMRKEFVAMKERHLEDQRVFLLRFEGDDWEKKLDEMGGKM
ncbi:hypothetical protein FAGAP_394 [Fusarium agapanthi]|uniref:Uncharacterized protein n=1 Tax=Fusarium agapanthi TaxID=1803897 RepID=A0A9P5BL60_9HYPO|nr:hypothetical protein FAGAP_394 [Fusarium agapanthi]